MSQRRVMDIRAEVKLVLTRRLNGEAMVLVSGWAFFQRRTSFVSEFENVATSPFDEVLTVRIGEVWIEDNVLV